VGANVMNDSPKIKQYDKPVVKPVNLQWALKRLFEVNEAWRSVLMRLRVKNTNLPGV
jgi:hypothetical protein